MENEIKDHNFFNSLYKECESCDKQEFAEMRTNLQMVSGDHYQKTASRFWNRLRDSKVTTPDQKIRLTKNHIGRIAKIYQNSILSCDPSVTISPKQEKEIQHQKAAELHNSVLAHIKEKHDINRKRALWAKDYVEIGEIFVKVFWDPQGGIQVGWQPQMDEMGQPVFDQMTGQPVQSQIPVMSGDLIFETVHGFDLLRQNGIKTLEESPFLCIRKMESVKDLKKKFGDDPNKESFIKESSEDTFRVYQSSVGGMSKTTGMTMVREFYYKPCAEYPKGYYYITVEGGILDEGELPFGIFPIVHCGFDELTTSPRSKSIIKQLRPYQLEINRASSKMAEHQITLGDDKIVYQSGVKPSSGASKSGIREIAITGSQPTIIPGRTGDQYLPYINAQIAEMYQVADVSDLDKEINGQLDPYTLLFRSASQKQKFSFYTAKFGRFYVKVHETALNLFKKYASPHLLIPVLGKNEQLNIEEFKNASDVCWEIKLEEMGDDIETKMGKQLTLNHILQFIGPQMDKKDIGKMLRLAPYLNTEKMFSDMTQDYDNLTNDIVALDAGRPVMPNKYDKHDYIVAGLISRMKQPGFRFLSPQIQQMYEQKKTIHEQMLAQQQEQIKQAESGFIPSGGYLVVCDLYVPQPNNPGKTQRVRVPSEALDWLLKKLQIQGSSQEQLMQIGNQQAIADIAGMVSQNPQAGPPMGNEGVINGLN